MAIVATTIRRNLARNMHSQAVYDALFADLSASLRSDGWETRQESQPRAYLHVSRPTWEDANLDGIHLETYVLSGQLKSQHAVVALHCEGGWPKSFRSQFMGRMTERIQPAIAEWNASNNEKGNEDLGQWLIKGPSGSSVCEVLVPFGVDPKSTLDRIHIQLKRLATMQNAIDEVICACKSNAHETPWHVFPRSISKQEVLTNNGQDGQPLWAVIDGYVVDATKMLLTGHPGGKQKILSVNDPSAGWTGKAFGFSLARGANAHFSQTARKFRDGVGEFENGGKKDVVTIDYGPNGSIVIIGVLVESNK